MNAEIAALEPRQAKIAEQLEAMRVERDVLEHEVLKLEPSARLTQRGATVALVLGVPSGLALMAWWFEQPWNGVLAAALPLVASATWLLRGAWRAGRASGARGPG